MTFYPTGLTCQIKGFSDILTKHIGNKTNGVFVEIGAMNGETWSCTAGLADIGWEGHYVEPQTDQCFECKVRHQLNNVTIDNLAIGKETGTLTLYKAYGNACATTSDTDMRDMLTEYFDVSEITAPMTTLDEYLNCILYSPDPATLPRCRRAR